MSPRAGSRKRPPGDGQESTADDILDLSKIEAAGSDVGAESRRVSVPSFGDRVPQARALGREGHRASKFLLTPIPSEVSLGSDRIRQAVVEPARQAIKFTRAGLGKLRVS